MSKGSDLGEEGHGELGAGSCPRGVVSFHESVILTISKTSESKVFPEAVL